MYAYFKYCFDVFFEYQKISVEVATIQWLVIAPAEKKKSFSQQKNKTSRRIE
jgi:hypothetical protein